MKVPFLDLTLQHQPLRDEILAAWAATLDGNRFCLGRDVEEFEKAFAVACGANDSVGVDNGTSALHLVAQALGLGPGDDVIVPAFTFIASAWTATYVGARPVFADIDPAHYCVTADTIRAVLTPQTKAIVVVHLFGQPAPMAAILAIAAERGLKVIEDCAQAHLAQYRARPVGLLGDAGTFSFYPTKNLGGCGEGVAVARSAPATLAISSMVVPPWGLRRPAADRGRLGSHQAALGPPYRAPPQDRVAPSTGLSDQTGHLAISQRTSVEGEVVDAADAARIKRLLLLGGMTILWMAILYTLFPNFFNNVVMILGL